MIFLKILVLLNYLVITTAIVMNIKFGVEFRKAGLKNRSNATFAVAALWLLWGIIYSLIAPGVL